VESDFSLTTAMRAGSLLKAWNAGEMAVVSHLTNCHCTARVFHQKNVYFFLFGKERAAQKDLFVKNLLDAAPRTA